MDSDCVVTVYNCRQSGDWAANGSVVSSVARAFPGGRVAHLEDQNEEKNENMLRKNESNWLKFWGKMRKEEILPTRDSEAGYGPECSHRSASSCQQSLHGHRPVRVQLLG